ncbi:MAG: N-formylglutamate amidohydrolase [Sphingobium sp.]
MDHAAPLPPVERTAAYDRYGPDVPTSPVVLSVPHAGRLYRPELLARMRVGADVAQRLEDRGVDWLAHDLIASGASVVIARTPRAVIDLNRGEREIDPDMVADLPRGMGLQSSAKLRGGLGLIPRRMPGVAELWRGRLGWDEIAARIETVHRPYHEAVARLLDAARAAHGTAVLIDLHSMPPLPSPGLGMRGAQIVLGDRFGRTAAGSIVAAAQGAAAAMGYEVARNHPYAGDHMIGRHGRPETGVHAIQVEVDRSCYLDAMFEEAGPGLARARALVTGIAEGVARAVPGAEWALAAE